MFWLYEWEYTNGQHAIDKNQRKYLSTCKQSIYEWDPNNQLHKYEQTAKSTEQKVLIKLCHDNYFGIHVWNDEFLTCDWDIHFEPDFQR